MNKFQKLSFRDIGDFFDYLPRDEERVATSLRNIILETVPELKEKLAYNVPFYYLRRRICYIWPSSIPWGGLVPGSGVALGFVNGRQIAADYLTGGGGRDVRYRLFMKPGDIDRHLVQDLLIEAVQRDMKS